MTNNVVCIPDIGEEGAVDVIEISVAVGDKVNAEDSLIVLESDKATIEVPSPSQGVVEAISVAVGDKVSQGTPILTLVADNEENQSPAASSPERPGHGAKHGSLEQQGDRGQLAKEKLQQVANDDSAVRPNLEEKSAEAKTNTETANDGNKQQAAVVDLVVPDMGDVDEAEVIEFLAEVGSQVEQDNAVIVLESDKASMEIPADETGELVEFCVAIGDKIKQGEVFAKIKTSAASCAPSSTESDHPATPESTDGQAAPASQKPSSPVGVQSSDGEDKSSARSTVHAGPAVRLLARKLGINLELVQGSGPKNRILKEDLYGFIKQGMAQRESALTKSDASPGVPPLPQIDFSKFGPVEELPRNKIQRVSAQNLLRSWQNVPQVTQFDEADITELEAFRKQQKDSSRHAGVKLTMLPFLVKASAAALRTFPDFNASLDDAKNVLVRKQFINIGVAVDTPNGLLVPVIKEADKKGVSDIAMEIQDLAQRAKERKIAPADLQGGCFSISSLGGIGGTNFTPIVNWPEVAILGVSRSQLKPQWNGEQFEPRLMLPFSLSYDHRVIDGAAAALFTRYIANILADIRQLVL